jgi:RHS repeat-associated protein
MSAPHPGYPIDRSRFSGKCKRAAPDWETELDNFGARMYGPVLGRFTSPDAPLVDQDAGDPQSWNLYGYVRNNPLSFVDPTGRESGPPVSCDHFSVACLAYHLERSGSLFDLSRTTLEKTFEWWSRERNQPCMSIAMVNGAALGTAAGGGLGLLMGSPSGPGALASMKAGAFLGGPPGALLGCGMGMVACMTDAGPSGGGESGGGGGGSSGGGFKRPKAGLSGKEGAKLGEG